MKWEVKREVKEPFYSFTIELRLWNILAPSVGGVCHHSNMYIKLFLFIAIQSINSSPVSSISTVNLRRIVILLCILNNKHFFLTTLSIA